MKLSIPLPWAALARTSATDVTWTVDTPVPQGWATEDTTIDTIQLQYPSSGLRSRFIITLASGALQDWFRLDAPWTWTFGGEEYDIHTDRFLTFGQTITILLPAPVLVAWLAAVAGGPDSILSIDDLATGDDLFYGHQTIRIPAFGTEPARNLWTGDGDLTIGGVTYLGTAIGRRNLMAIDATEDTLGEPSIRARVTIGVAAETARRVWQQYRGPLECQIGWVWSRDGLAWNELSSGDSPIKFFGYTSNLEIKAGRVTFDLEPLTGDYARGKPAPRTYSYESQLSLHPGDTCLKHVRGLRQRKIRLP